MDFDFVRGSEYKRKDYNGRLVTSIDSFRSYLIIVYHATRYKSLFLTPMKYPPLSEVEQILKKFQASLIGLKCTLRTNQGGELGKSNTFCELLKNHTNSSVQNGISEKPNQDLKRITQSLLHAAGLSSAYWIYAINHTVFLANRQYHSTIKMTPFQVLRHTQPDLTELRILGGQKLL